MSEWRELTWDDAIQRGYEALVGGEARYEEIDAEQGRSNIDTESTCGALTRTTLAGNAADWSCSLVGRVLGA
jgi:hypothetical protein